MADKINVTVAPTTFNVAAGDTAEAVATLRNLGQTVDQFTLSIAGLDPSWYTLPVSSVALFPNDEDSLKILLHPPKGAETETGSFPFRIEVASQENPEETATVDLVINMGKMPMLEVEISPQRIAGRKGSYQIIVHNPGDNEARVHLTAGDTKGGLRLSLDPDRLIVPRHDRSESTLEARLGWLALVGIGEKEFNFQVKADVPVGRFAGEVRAVEGQLLLIPWYRSLPKIPKIRLPWLERPPEITEFRATTDDRREFKLSWKVKKATEVRLDGEDVDREGETLVRPAEVTSYVLTVNNKYGTSSQTIEVRPPPTPIARVSERIRVSLTPSDIQASASGIPGQATLQLQNLGDIVDKFLVEIEGMDETWYSRSASSIALMPQASDQVQISFQPPKKKGVKARAYPFAVTVRSQSMPDEATTVLGQLEVQPSIEFKLSVRPYRVTSRRKGNFRINIANTGVSDAGFVLDATDLDEGLDFRLGNDSPEVRAWETIEVPIIARPKRGSTVGERKRYDITITATDPEGKTQSANCEFNHKPFMTSWRPVIRIVRALLILAAVGTLVYFVLHWGGGWRTLTSSPQTWVNQLVRTVEGWFFR